MDGQTLSLDKKIKASNGVVESEFFHTKSRASGSHHLSNKEAEAQGQNNCSKSHDTRLQLED